MRKISILIAVSALLFVQCKENEDPFLLSEKGVGKLTPTTKVKQLDSIFAMDSIVKTSASPNAIETQGEVEVYEKGGKRLLFLTPKNENDPNSEISDILIYDSRFQTKEGLNSNSTFKDFKEAYTISRIDRILNGVLVSFEDSDIYLTIDAKQLTPEARDNRDLKIEPAHIFDSAPIKYLRIDWDNKE